MIGPMIVKKVKMISKTPINSKRHEPAPEFRTRLERDLSSPPQCGQYMPEIPVPPTPLILPECPVARQALLRALSQEDPLA